MKERRKAKRFDIIDSFSVSLVLPGKGGYRLKINDLSEIGINFDFDLKDEEPAPIDLASDEDLDAQLYLNQTLFLPFKMRVIRVTENKGIRTVGAEVSDADEAVRTALSSFVIFISNLEAAL